MTYPGETQDYPEAPYSYTMKDARGDLFTVRGIDYDDFAANLGAVIGAERVVTVTEELAHRIDTQPNKGSQGAAPAASAPQSGGAAPAPQAGAQAPAQGGDWKAQAPFCAHGQRSAREWTAKSGPNAGKQQYTYFCPQGRDVPADQKCKPIDAISGKEWA